MTTTEEKIVAVTNAFNAKFTEFIGYVNTVVPGDQYIGKMKLFLTIFNGANSKRSKCLLIDACTECISKEFGDLIKSNKSYAELIETIGMDTVRDILDRSHFVKTWKNADSTEEGADKEWIAQVTEKYISMVTDPNRPVEYKTTIWNYIVMLDIMCTRYADLRSRSS